MPVRVSVAMAVYNGEKYLKEQLDSILPQLSCNDELVISYNESADRTWEIINGYASADSRIKVVRCPEKGIKANFNSAITNCSGDYIFLSDQDDVWLEGKIDAVLDAFNKTGAAVIVHDCIITDGNLVPTGRTLFRERKATTNFFRNLIKNCYHGCCMAFSSRLTRYIIPIPANIPLHDAWIGFQGNVYGKVVLLDKQLVMYRRHGLNCSGKQKILKRISDRLNIMFALTCAYFRINYKK